MASDPVLEPVAAGSKGRRRKTRPSAGRLESILARQGYRLIGGVDEVGRGALAGPLVAAAVLFDTRTIPGGLCDSKLLSPEEREACVDAILDAACAVSYAVADVETIDDSGIQVANQAALERAILGLRPLPEFVISDHFGLADPSLPNVGLPKADGLSAAVAAASILAKVARDGLMCSLDAEHPGYGLSRNKGYGTEEHWVGIRAFGPSPIHRRSFRGVAAWQPEMFEGS